jgi:signal transduction histidine kinase
MSQEDQIATLRHDLANPLAAMLAEVQLLLLGDAPMDDEVRTALTQMEQLALRMRTILRATREESA